MSLLVTLCRFGRFVSLLVAFVSEVLVSGYGTGGGDKGWDASFVCCTAGVECAWDAFGGITYGVNELPALVETCGSEQIMFYRSSRYRQRALQTGSP